MPTTLHFELRLSDALRRAGETDIPELGASMYLVPLEYEIMRAVCCPGCGLAGLRREHQTSLAARDDEQLHDWLRAGGGPAGDRLVCVCPACLHVTQLNFWFRSGDLALVDEAKGATPVQDEG